MIRFNRFLTLLFMKRETSAGGVVFRKLGKTVYILLIKDGHGRWALPKGHVERGETLQETAVREVQEETGVEKLEVLGRIDEIRYFYTRKMPDAPSETVFKTNTFYLMRTSQVKLHGSWEVQDVKWFPSDESIKIVEYKNSLDILKKAAEMIKKLGKKT